MAADRGLIILRSRVRVPPDHGPPARGRPTPLAGHTSVERQPSSAGGPGQGPRETRAAPAYDLSRAAEREHVRALAVTCGWGRCGRPCTAGQLGGVAAR